MAIVEMMPDGFCRFSPDRSSMIPLHNLANDERFEKILESRQLLISTNQGHQQQLQLNDLQAKVDRRRHSYEHVQEVSRVRQRRAFETDDLSDRV